MKVYEAFHLLPNLDASPNSGRNDDNLLQSALRGSILRVHDHVHDERTVFGYLRYGCFVRAQDHKYEYLMSQPSP